MFFQGQLASTITLPQVLADITGILTGTITSAAGLSVSFTPGSSFTNTLAPGWSVFDADAGAVINTITPRVIRAPLKGSATLYKHVLITSITAGQLQFNGFETWDTTTNSGTFPIVAVPVGSSWQSWTPAVNQLITISASADHFYIAAGTNDITPNTFILVAEYSRDDPWNTLANGYHAWIQSGVFNATANATTANSAITRAYNPSAPGDVSPILFGGSASSLVWATVSADFGLSSTTPVTPASGGGAMGASISTQVNLAGIAGADANKAAARYLYSMGVRQMSPTNNASHQGVFLGGSITSVSGVLAFLAQSAAIGGDIIAIGADNYYVGRVPAFTSALIAIKKV